MPFKTKRKFRNKKRKPARKKKAMANNFINVKPEYSIKEWDRFTADAGSQGAVVISDTADSLSAITFRLTDLANATTYQRLFDYYKINYVVVRFVPVVQELHVGNMPTNQPSSDISAGDIVPNYVVCIDRDDDILSSYATLVKRAGAKIQKCTQPLTIGFAPSTINMTLRRPVSQLTNPSEPLTVSDVGYEINQQSNFLNTGGPTVTHYGLKFAIEGSTNPPGVYGIRLETKYYVTFGQRV